MEDLVRTVVLISVLPGAVAGLIYGLWGLGQRGIRAALSLILGGLGGFGATGTFWSLAAKLGTSPNSIVMAIGPLLASALGGLVLVWIARRLFGGGGPAQA